MRDLTIDVIYESPTLDYGQLVDGGGYVWSCGPLSGCLSFAPASASDGAHVEANHRATAAAVRDAAIAAFASQGGNADDVADVYIDGPCTWHDDDQP